MAIGFELAGDARLGARRVGDLAPGIAFAFGHQLLRVGQAEVGHAGRQHLGAGGVEVDRRAFGQQRHVRLQRGQAGAADAQPGQVGQLGRDERGVRGLRVVGRELRGAHQRLCGGVQFGGRQVQQLVELGEHLQIGHRQLGLGLCASAGHADEVEEVQPRLLVAHLARQERGQRLVGAVVLVDREEAGQARFLQRHGPGFAQVVGVAAVLVAARVLAQDQARPVQRAGQDPARLHPLAFGRFHLDGAPLLPQRGRGECRNQGHCEHGQEQGSAFLTEPLLEGDRPPKRGGALPGHRRAGLAGRPVPPPGGGVTRSGAGGIHDPASSVGRTQSRVSVPCMACPVLSVSTRRTPLGRLVVVAAPADSLPTDESGLPQVSPRW